MYWIHKGTKDLKKSRLDQRENTIQLKGKTLVTACNKITGIEGFVIYTGQIASLQVFSVVILCQSTPG